MDNFPRARVWFEHSLFAILVLALVFFQLLPLSTLPSGWAGPDLILCITLAWTARRPDLVPVLLIAAVFLLCDLLFQRPPGLWTALVLIATETLRSRALQLRVLPFWIEWIWIMLAILGLMLAYRTVLSLAVLPLPNLSQMFIQAMATIAAYPVIVLLSYLLFRINRPLPGGTDAGGQKI